MAGKKLLHFISKVATFLFALLFTLNYLSSNAQAQVSDADLIQLRSSIHSWARDFVCEGITPTKKPSNCPDKGGPDNGGSEVGDSILFSSLLCYSVENWACQNIPASKDEQGGMWRSPQRLRSRSDGSWGNARFSQDHMIGVLLYLVTEYNRGNVESARSFANHWGSWMANHLSQGEFSLCDWDWTDLEAMDSCALEGDIFGARAAMIRRVFDHIGANSPERRWRVGGIIPTWRSYRLGDRRDPHDYLGYLNNICALAPSRGKKFNCHLPSVTSLIFQEMGDNQRLGSIDEGFRENPFVLWVNNGRQANNQIRKLTLDRCTVADAAHRSGSNTHQQWAWERSQFEATPPWRNSFGWDCVTMINLLKPNPSVRAHQVIGNSGWTGSIAVDDGYVYLATSEGQLRRGRISSSVVTELIGNGGWIGSIAVDDGYVYLATSEGRLLRGRVNP